MSEEILETTSPLVEEATENQVADAPLAAPEAIAAPVEADAPDESFGDAFAEFERTHQRKA